MTFGPGSTYGDGGTSATDAYYVLTYVGIAVTVLVIVFWVHLGEQAPAGPRRPPA